MTKYSFVASVLALVCFLWTGCSDSKVQFVGVSMGNHHSRDVDDRSVDSIAGGGIIETAAFSRTVVSSSVGEAKSDNGVAKEAIPVTLKQGADGGWQLFRDGKPFYIQGVGGETELDRMVAAGVNSHRTWGADENTIKILDAAHAKGLTVAVGLWLQHERHGFDYEDFDKVSEQIDSTLANVKRLKDHPAVLVWGLGNEMEIPDTGDNPSVWHHVEHLAKLIKEEDPHHPVMTVIAEVGGRKVEAINKLCPSVDIIGINSYGGGPSLPKRMAEFKSKKPYIVTEFGPAGPWEVGKNNLDTPVEKSSTEKAADYRASYNAFKADSKNCLGCYAFLWGHKMEATATWFGMMLPDGRKLAPVDTMSELWTGKPPANRCPEIKSFKLEGENLVADQATVKFALQASDPDGDKITVKFVLMADTAKYLTGGDFQETPPVFPENILASDQKSASIKMPTESGLYRVYAYVNDSKNGSAVANIPVRVKGEAVSPGMKTKMPHVVFDETGEQRIYAPSGFMGSVEAMTVNEQCATDPKSGKHCLEVNYSKVDDWGGVVWQHPADDWGELDGGVDLTDAKKLTFWAKGNAGGEVIKFGFGVLGQDKKFYDTTRAEEEITLTKEWKQYSLDVKGDKTRIKSGFYWSLAGQGKPLKFYLDRIVYE